MCLFFYLLKLNRLQFGVNLPGEFDQFTPRPGIRPSEPLNIVKLNSDGQCLFDLANWGLIPHWAKEKPRVRPGNARAETVASNGVFRDAFKRRRCLIPASGFFEWQGEVKPKPLYAIHLKSEENFAFAGLWEMWQPHGGPEIRTCTIITTTPNALMTDIHDRMPVILPPEDYDRWLQEGGIDLLRQYPADAMTAHLVENRPQKKGNDNQPSLFGPDV